ncbi:MAG: CRISPR-associated endonuclease Cas1, partial [Bryobacteraceae bacterium]|nr:CRISPR-associated endonuclease Cas1 [Bryobacteraceae bacterium]
MAVTTVFVCQPGAVLARRSRRLVVQADGGELVEIPVRETAAVALFGPVQVTAQALALLFRHRVPLAFFSRQGRLRGRLAPALSSHAGLRLEQYRAAGEAACCLRLARPLVEAKLANSARLLAAYRRNYPGEALAAAQQRLAGLARQAREAASLAELLGCEGAGAAVYFNAVAALNRSGLAFAGRRMHPPPDPFNALLSLGYTLALTELLGLAEARGLDPYVGFLHRTGYGRPSLALDLVEPFRPALVDRLTLRLVNERILTAADFQARTPAGGRPSVVLKPEALRRYLEHYAHAVARPRRPGGVSLREEMARQVDRLARALMSGGEWTAFVEH